MTQSRIEVGRREAIAAFALALVSARRAVAEEVSVPLELQVELFAKVAAYDKNLGTRAGDRVRIVVMKKDGAAESERAAGHLAQSLGAIDSIAGLPVSASVSLWQGADALRAAVDAQRLSAVYFAPGFSEDAATIASKLTGADVLSVSAVSSLVPRGLVLGFDLVSGKPKILVHLTQAKSQNVAFKAEVLKLMKVIE